MHCQGIPREPVYAVLDALGRAAEVPPDRAQALALAHRAVDLPEVQPALGVVVDGEGAIREAAVACQAPEAWYRTDYECLVGTVMFLVAEVLPGLVGMVRAVWIRAEGWNHVIPPSLLRCGRHRRLWIGNMVRGTTKKLYHRHEASPSSKPMDRMRGRDVANNVISKMSM